MKKTISILIVLAFVISSCNPWKFSGKYNKSIDFEKYKTFGLLNWNKENDKEIRPETKKYILMSIKDEMEKRGYVYKQNNADLQISIYVLVNQETSYSAYVDHYAGYSGYGGVAVGVGVGTGGTTVGAVGYGMPTLYPYTTVKHDYNVGSVIVDLLDHTKKQIVWQGLAQGRIAQGGVSEANIKRDVSRLFQSFPVKKKKK